MALSVLGQLMRLPLGKKKAAGNARRSRVLIKPLA